MTKDEARARKSFEAYTPKYTVTIESDNGAECRSIFVSTGCITGHFRIVTAPGVLLIDGDYGTFVFKRLRDMFEFFGGRPGHVNLDYWCEKLVAGEGLAFCSDTFLESIKSEIEQWAEGRSYASTVADEVFQTFKSHLGDEVNDQSICFERYYKFTESNVWDWDDMSPEAQTFAFSPPFEGSCNAYTFRFIWCCYAIQWTIDQYRKMAAAKAVPA